VTPPHGVVIVAFPGVDLLDVTGPAEVFAMANKAMPHVRPPYQVRLAGPAGQPEIRTLSGMRLVPDVSLDDLRGPIDTLLVPGAVDCGPNGAKPIVDGTVVDWLRRAGPLAGRLVSVCAGAHALADAGLLDGATATTHWGTAARLAAEHPDIEVNSDKIFIRTGRVWTGAGICSAMDLALALVAEDHGDEVSLSVARWMVMYPRRTGGQTQFRVMAVPAVDSGGRIDELRRWIGDHLTADLSAAVLARQMHLSPRQFARVFRRETGSTPATYVEAIRVEAARRLLETMDGTLSEVAKSAGLNSAETLHRAFRRRLSTTPGAYRSRFRQELHSSY
jgi:transcriptional regulator GlxA family with amidase domain